MSVSGKHGLESRDPHAAVARRDQVQGRVRVLILGAGYAGLRAATSLGSDPRFDVTLLDRFPRQVEKTRLHELNRVSLKRDLARFFQHSSVRFLSATVTALECAERRVRTEEETISYDKLIVALGSQASSLGVTGVADHCVTLDGAGDGARFAHLVALLRDRAERLVIVGGGSTGVEAAAEAVTILGPGRVVLVEAAGTLMAGAGEFTSTYASFALRRRGVQVRPRTKVVEVQADAVLLAGGERVVCGGTLWCAGVSPSPLLTEAAPTSALGALDENLRSRVFPDVYVVGDSSAAGRKSNSRPSAQMAVLEGDYVAADIVSRLGESRAPAFNGHRIAEITSLGGFDAVGWLFLPGVDLPLVGPAAWLFKELGALRNTVTLQTRRFTLAFTSGRLRAQCQVAESTAKEPSEPQSLAVA